MVTAFCILLATIVSIAQADCDVTLAPPTPTELMRIVRGLQEVSPYLNVQELKAKSRDVELVSAGIARRLTMAQVEAAVNNTFGSWVAALEYAGFGVDHLPNPRPDLPEWTMAEAVKRTWIINKHFSLHPRAILSNAVEIEAQWAKGKLKKASVLGLWRFAKAECGSWNEFVANHINYMRGYGAREFRHPASAKRRLPLGRLALVERRRAQAERLRRFARTPLGTSHPPLIQQLERYLAVNGDFYDAAEVYYWLIRNLPELDGLADWEEIVGFLGPQAERARPDR